MELKLKPRPCSDELDIFIDDDYVGHLLVSNRSLVLLVPDHGKPKCYDNPAALLRDLTGGIIYGKA